MTYNTESQATPDPDLRPEEAEPRHDAMWRPEPTLAEMEAADRAFDVREDF